MNSRAPQYFGVAGTTTPDEVSQLVGFLDVLGMPDHVRFMNGPLVSFKTLNEKEPGNPRRYPPVSLLPSLLIDDPRVINIVHYNSRKPDLYSQLIKLIKISPLIHGVQLNIADPDLDDLIRFKREHPDVLVVLQLGLRVFSSCNNDVFELIRYVRHYEEVVDYALLDLSGGEGIPVDLSVADTYVREMSWQDTPVVTGVTGGLRSDTVLKLTGLLERDTSLCWDVESGVRTNDVLDMGKCFGFCAASAALLRQ